VGYLRLNGDRVPEAIDALSFHLPDVVRWTQLHGFWQIHQFIPDLAHGNYPNNGDVLSLLAVLNFHDLGLARLVFVPWLILTGVGVHALARELGAPRSTATVFGALAAGLPVVARSALLGVDPDVVMYASFTSGIAFLVRHRRTGDGASLMLAGLGLGIALGTKWYGVSAFVVVLVVWAALRLTERVALRRLAGDGALLCGVALAAGGFWLLRNWILSGNPLFPVKVTVGGATIFDAPFDPVRARGGFTLAHYAGDGSILRHYVWPAFKDGYGFAPLVLAAGALAAIGLGRAQRLIVGMTVLAGGLALAYAVTPYSAQGPEGLPVQVSANTRYGVPALLVGAALCAFTAGRLGRARPLAEGIGVLLAFDGVRRAFHVPGHTIATSVVVLALLLAAAWTLRALSVRRRLAPVVAAAVLVGAFGVARRLDTHLDHTAWQADPALAWVRAHADGGTRIGLAGLWPTGGGVAPVLPAFGDHLSNRVTYIGPFERHMLRQYSSGGAFIARLHRERVSLLIVGRGFPRALPQTREDRWARAAGMHPVARSNRFTLYGY
jgi:Dolichyl-phosphate-mannose-protein mannosyltransferase